MSSDRDYSVAIAHGNFLERGGAELVSEELAKCFDGAPLYYGFGLDEDEVSTDEVEAHSLYNDTLTRKFADSVFLRDMFYFWNSDRIPELDSYDVVIQSKNELIWYTPPDTQTLIRYLHTTPRSPYDQYSVKGDSLLVKAYSKFARVSLQHVVPYADMYIANSELVARRAEQYWGVPREKIEVVYPPVDTESFGARETKDYYLTYSRLIPEKRIDAILEAFEELDKKLVIGGSGWYGDNLREMAPDNVEFVGYMSEDEKRQRLGEAKAVLFNAYNEDFGYIPVEAFASGTPVIGVEDGYTKYQIQSGKNGVSYTRKDTQSETAAEIRSAIREFESEGVSWESDEIEVFAEQYDVTNFQQRVRDIVDATHEESSITLPESPVRSDGES